MSNDKQDHNEPDKMSFDEAIRLAIKTPPPKTIKLKLNEQIEIPAVTGKIVALRTIEIPKKDCNDYMLELHIIYADHSSKTTPILFFNADLSRERIHSLYYIPDIVNTNPFMGGILNYITLLSVNNDTSEIKNCKLEYYVYNQ